MESKRFDALTRTLGSRRLVLGALFGGSLSALLGLAAPEEALAHNRLAFCKKLENPRQRKRCLKRAKAHIRRCHSAASRRITCDQRCGSVLNSCDNLVACTCPAERTCQGNGSCAKACLTIQECSSAQDCTCTFVTSGSENLCLADINECEQNLQECQRTTDCPVGQACRAVFCTDRFIQGCVPICGK